MSTIVAVQKDDLIVVAWDTLASVGPDYSAYAAPPAKVQRVGSSLVGIAGLAVYYNVLDHYLASREAPDLRDERSVFEFFVTFWRALGEHYHFVNNQSDPSDTTPFADLDAEFLVVNRQGLFRVKEILSVARFDRFCAIGSGAAHAEGALSVLHNTELNACEVARKSIEVALNFDRASGGQIRSLNVPPAS